MEIIIDLHQDERPPIPPTNVRRMTWGIYADRVIHRYTPQDSTSDPPKTCFQKFLKCISIHW